MVSPRFSQATRRARARQRSSAPPACRPRRRHRQVLAAGDAVAAGPDAVDDGAALGVDHDAAALSAIAGAVERVRRAALPDGLEHHVGVEREALAGAGELAVLAIARVLELDAAHGVAATSSATGRAQ